MSLASGRISRRGFLAAAGAAALLPRIGHAAAERLPERLVVAGGALTECVAALGETKRLVGVDTTSLYPYQPLAHLPRIGYMRTLSAEGILSLNPDMLLATDQAGPPAVLDRLRDAGLPIVMVPENFKPESAAEKLQAVGRALGKAEAGQTLAAALSADLKAMRDAAAQLRPKPRALFILGASGGKLMAAGHETAADLMLGLGGAVNVITEYKGYKPISGEAALMADPDVIVATDQALDSAGGRDALLGLPALASLKAVAEKRLVVMDTLLLLGLGPRIAAGARDLALALHPGAALPALPPRPWA